MVNQLRMWGPAALWAAVLFLLSSWPNPVGPTWLNVNDKVAHVALYAVLGAALAVGRLWSPVTPSHLLMVGVGALYGLLDEAHQSFVPGRTPSWGDWFADLCGVMLGYSLILFLARRSARPAPENGRFDGTR